MLRHAKNFVNFYVLLTENYQESAAIRMTIEEEE